MQGCIRGVMVVGMLGALVGCASELEVPSTGVAKEEASPIAVAPSSTPDPVAPAPPPSSPSSCEVSSVDTLHVGSACAPIGPGSILCASPVREGWVYACEVGARPPIAGCVSYLSALESGEQRTVVLCPSPSCVAFEDERCGTEQAMACPKPAFAPAVVPSSTCRPSGSWGTFGSSGPLYCCP